MKNKNGYVGNLSFNVTEKTRSRVEVRVSQEDLDYYKCADLLEFRNKVRKGEVWPFDCDYDAIEVIDRETRDVEHESAKVILPDGTELED